MQVANGAYSSAIHHSHYHPYYHLHPPGPQDHELKRQYLALLPPQQIIEICLTFDIHVPPYIKSTIWPPDINAAIADLQKTAQASSEKSAEAPPKEKQAPMDSLKSPDPPESGGTVEEPSASASLSESSTTSAASSSESDTSTTTAATENAPTTPSPAQPSTSTPTPETNATPAPAAVASPAPTQPMAPTIPLTHPQYPHQPYGYGHPPAAYPIFHHIMPKRQVHTHTLMATASMQTAYHQQPPTAYPPPPSQPSVYNNMLPISHPTQPPPPQMESGDDLPSYEEMIVEALTGCGDPEGWAPKDLFAWMASRYPLQSNFRPSASQALQKAYKRGRFEKSPNGKYRLSATWEGGNTTRRTTRRPQTQPSQSNTSAPLPPFTHAPLVHHHTPQQPYGYSPYSQSPYGSYTQAQPSTSTAPGTLAGASAAAAEAKAPAGATNSGTTTTAENASTDSDTADAYEAAQNILSAINFGSMYRLSAEEQQKGGVSATEQQQQKATTGAEYSSISSGVEHLLSHVQAILAGNAAGSSSSGAVGSASQSNATSAMTSLGHTSSANGLNPNNSSEDPRAELQAQLALLAAQLAELSQVEDSVPTSQHQPVQQQQQQQQQQSTSISVLQPLSHFNLSSSSTAPPPSTPLHQPQPHQPQPQDAFMRALPPIQTPIASTPDTSSSVTMQTSHKPHEPKGEEPPQLPQVEEEEESDDDDDDMEEII